MKVRFIFFATLVGVLSNSCSSDEAQWAKIKKTTEIYPRDSIVIYNSYVNGSVQRKWVNKSYRNYAYKKYCSNFVEASFDLSNPKVKGFLSFDSLSVGKLLRDHFRKKGVAHFVGQILTADELKIYIYHEDGVGAIYTLSDFVVPNIGLVKSDPDWKEYLQL